MGLKSLQLYGTEIKGGMGGNSEYYARDGRDEAHGIACKYYTYYVRATNILYFIAQIGCLSSAQARLRRAASNRAPPPDWARTT